MKIATVAVYVADEKSALQFWTEQIGFAVRRSHSIGLDLNWIELCDEGAESCLVLYPRSMMPDWAERKPSVVFECEDIDRTFRELIARGVLFTQPPKRLPWGMFAIFQDPEGNWYGLREKPAQGIAKD